MISWWDPARIASAACRRLARRYSPGSPVIKQIDVAIWNARITFDPRRVPGATRPAWVPPGVIERAIMDRRFLLARRWIVGKILDGDWDLNTETLERSQTVFQSIAQRVSGGCDWSDTSLYSYLMSLVGQDRHPFRSFPTESDVHHRLEQIDRLHELIRRSGYRTQKELGSHAPWDEINVVIGRNGDVLFLDGAHRFAIARALGLDSIPVLVTVVHRQWWHRGGGIPLLQRLTAHAGAPAADA